MKIRYCTLNNGSNVVVYGGFFEVSLTNIHSYFNSCGVYPNYKMWLENEDGENITPTSIATQHREPLHSASWKETKLWESIKPLLSAEIMEELRKKFPDTKFDLNALLKR